MVYTIRSVSIPSVSFSTSSKEQWLALTRMFVHASTSREYQLYQAPQGSRQGDRSIQDFYSLLSGYFEELQTMNIPILDSMSAFALMFQKQRDRKNPFHFAMQLHPEFKALLGSIFHLHLFPSLIESVVEFTFERYVFGYCHHHRL